MFIKQYLESWVKVSVLLGPNGFGKSFNLSMLKSFLSFGSNPKTFQDLLIGREQEIMEKHCGKYPVVFIDFKDCKGKNWEEMRAQIWRCISTMIQVHKDNNDISEDTDNREIYGVEHFAKFPIDGADRRSLQWLTECLFDKHKKRVIVLIDHYDTPWMHASQNGFGQDAMNFFEGFFSRGLKDNCALETTCLVGVVEVKTGRVLASFNNYLTYSITDDRYAPYFEWHKDQTVQ